MNIHVYKNILHQDITNDYVKLRLKENTPKSCQWS